MKSEMQILYRRQTLGRYKSLPLAFSVLASPTIILYNVFIIEDTLNKSIYFS